MNFSLFWQNPIKIKSSRKSKRNDKETKKPPESNEECFRQFCTLVDSGLWSWWSGSLPKLDAVQSPNGQLMDKVMVG